MPRLAIQLAFSQTVLPLACRKAPPKGTVPVRARALIKEVLSLFWLTLPKEKGRAAHFDQSEPFFRLFFQPRFQFWNVQNAVRVNLFDHLQLKSPAQYMLF